MAETLTLYTIFSKRPKRMFLSGGSGFQGRKTIHMKMEKQIFSIYMFVDQAERMGHREGF